VQKFKDTPGNINESDKMKFKKVFEGRDLFPGKGSSILRYLPY